MAENTVINRDNLVCSIFEFPEISSDNFSPVFLRETNGLPSEYVYVSPDVLDTLRYSGFAPYRIQRTKQENPPPWSETHDEREAAGHTWNMPNVELEDTLLTVLKEDKIIVNTMFQESLIIEDSIDIVDIRVSTRLASQESSKFMYLDRKISSPPEDGWAFSLSASVVTKITAIINKSKNIFSTISGIGGFSIATTDVELVQKLKIDSDRGVVYPDVYEESSSSPTYSLDDEDIECINKVIQEMNKLYGFKPFKLESFSSNINTGLNDFSISARLPKLSAETYRKVAVETSSRKRFGFVVHEKGADIFTDTGLSGIKVLDTSLTAIKEFGELTSLNRSDLEGYSSTSLSGKKTIVPTVPELLQKRVLKLGSAEDFDASSDWTTSGLSSIANDSDGTVTVTPGTGAVSSMSMYKDISSYGLESGDKVLIELDVINWLPVLVSGLTWDFTSIRLTNSSHSAAHSTTLTASAKKLGMRLQQMHNGVSLTGATYNEEFGDGSGNSPQIQGKAWAVYEITDDVDYIEINFESDTSEVYKSTDTAVFRNLTIKLLEA